MSNLCYLTNVRLLISSRAGINGIFLSEKTFFLHACATCYELLSNVSIMPFDFSKSKPKNSGILQKVRSRT